MSEFPKLSALVNEAIADQEQAERDANDEAELSRQRSASEAAAAKRWAAKAASRRRAIRKLGKIAALLNE